VNRRLIFSAVDHAAADPLHERAVGHRSLGKALAAFVPGTGVRGFEEDQTLGRAQPEKRAAARALHDVAVVGFWIGGKDRELKSVLLPIGLRVARARVIRLCSHRHTSRMKLAKDSAPPHFRSRRACWKSWPSLFQAKEPPSCEPAKMRSPFGVAATQCSALSALSSVRSFADSPPGAPLWARAPCSGAASRNRWAAMIGPVLAHDTGVDRVGGAFERVDLFTRLHVQPLIC